MGQKSNSLTLRPHFFQANLASVNTRSVFSYLKFLKYFEFLLKKKGVFLVSRTLNTYNNQCYFLGNFFYSSAKTSFYKKKTKKVTVFTVSKLIKISALFFKVSTLLKTSLFVVSFSVLNRLVNSDLLKFFYLKLKKYIPSVFQRRFLLFIDFLKILCLFCQNLVSLNYFLHILGQSFKSVDKRLHTQFLSFLKVLFEVLVVNLKQFSPSLVVPIGGIKLVLSGKFRGKARATTKTVIEGSVPVQTISKNVIFSKISIYTLLGVFGFKIWVFKH